MAEPAEHGLRFRTHRHVRDTEQPGRDVSTHEDPGEEREVPQTGVLPVITEELDARRREGCAQMAQVARNPELPVPKEEQGGNEEADQRPCHIPGPWAREHIEHDLQGQECRRCLPAASRKSGSGNPLHAHVRTVVCGLLTSKEKKA
jgi:hypothetical protein